MHADLCTCDPPSTSMGVHPRVRVTLHTPQEEGGGGTQSRKRYRLRSDCLRAVVVASQHCLKRKEVGLSSHYKCLYGTVK